MASLSQVRTAAAQCGLFTHTSVPVIFEPPCITPSAIFTRFGTQRFSPLLSPKRRFTWTSLHIGWGGKGEGAWPAGTATKEPSPDEFMHKCNVGGDLQNVVGSTMKTDGTLLYLLVFYTINHFIVPVSIWKTTVLDAGHFITRFKYECAFASLLSL